MTRLAYSLLLWAALPFALARLAWRARRQPGYTARLRERFGAVEVPVGGPVIWVHAVSVGETRAAAPLVAALRERHPGSRILLTHMTPTGYETGLELFGDGVLRAWLPYDHGFAVRRFLSRARPAFGMILETEIWPNLLAQCARRGVPVFLVNARLSARSAARYARAAALVREALGNFTGVAAQSEEDAARLAALGARDVAVTGNIKFDLAVPPDTARRGRELRQIFGTARRIFVVGSTRDGEEALVAQAVAEANPAPDVLVVIVPRHPQRFEEVAAMLQARGEALSRRSLGQAVPADKRYVVGDSMGEMLAYYACADVVLMGGSLKPFGGQNLIEACAVGRPVIFGPHTFNFEQAAEAALAQGAGLRARDAREAVAMALALLDDRDRCAQMGARALAFAQANRGALARLLDWLEPRAALSRDPGRG
jgi:3-deoxy-D-manno-octulosonic-acid transferase